MAGTASHNSVAKAPYSVAIILAVLSTVVLIINIPPFIWHLQNRNIPIGSLLFWIIVLNFFSCCNAILWPNDDLYNLWPGYGLCDIQVKLVVGSWAALPSCVAAIMRNLSSVLDTRNVNLRETDSKSKSRRLFVDFAICWLPAFYLMAIHYIVQPFRYYIYGVSGCQPSFHNSWPSYVLVFACPLVIAMVAAGYIVLVSVRVHKYRRQFASLLSSSSVSKSRFVKLYVVCLVLICTLIPMHAYTFAEHMFVKLDTYSWAKVHAHWNQIYPVFSYGVALFDRWIRLGIALVAFFCFGLGQDARQKYQAWLMLLRLTRGIDQSRGSRISTGTRSSICSLRWLQTCVSSFGRTLSHPILGFKETDTSSTDHTRTGSLDSTDSSISDDSLTSIARLEKIYVGFDEDVEQRPSLFTGPHQIAGGLSDSR